MRKLRAVAAVTELVDQAGMRRRPAESVTSIGRERALIEQEDFSEIGLSVDDRR